ncbi:hypothetical protein NC653_022913 [Populus alba x Populus x berolinensis]|uniref:Uncharacterized protein n=1 Tax=Populus alba x Populus x berolinensis TaxID=444605 RepID=A0AAD6MH91_9ROSI|nr:hypothetical protein NC653_022913 [Populus alba x Populus x berolinensis]
MRSAQAGHLSPMMKFLRSVHQATELEYNFSEVKTHFVFQNDGGHRFIYLAHEFPHHGLTELDAAFSFPVLPYLIC